jgi:2-C-methyl-D-erythritol 4-phosphate cytidylyltransferase
MESNITGIVIADINASPPDTCTKVIAGKPILEWSILALVKSLNLNEVIVAPIGDLSSSLRSLIPKMRAKYQININVLAPSLSRITALQSALNSSPNSKIIVIHEHNRPLAVALDLKALVQQLGECDAAVCTVPVKSTVKHVLEGKIHSTVPRDKLVYIQPPYILKRESLQKCLTYASSDHHEAYDEISLAFELGLKIRAVNGSYMNFAIQNELEAAFAEQTLAQLNMTNICK